MATTIETTAPGVSVTRFWGGTDRGVCIQINAPGRPGSEREFNNFVQLTLAEAQVLSRELLQALAELARDCEPQDDPQALTNWRAYWASHAPELEPFLAVLEAEIQAGAPGLTYPTDEQMARLREHVRRTFGKEAGNA